MAAPTRRNRTSKKPGDDSPGMKIELDGRTYVVRQSDITPRLAAEIRRETGFAGFVGLSKESQRGFDLDVVAALVWVARRIEGEDVAYDTVLDQIGYDSDLEVGLVDERTPSKDIEGEVVPNPEA